MRLFLMFAAVVMLAGCAETMPAPINQQLADQDGDGVADLQDRCPQSPQNVAVGTDGCALDSDLDGVFDYLDRCPGTLAGFPVDLNGCPFDTDNDGVPDGRDKCPDTGQAVRIDANGCEVQTRVSVPEVPPELELRVLFRSGQSVLLPGNEAEFVRGVAFISDHPHSRVVIEGHTDSVGPAAFNRTLSERRARVVSQQLTARLGADAPAMKVLGVGEARPIADNGTQQGRAQNRRVVIRMSAK